MVILMLRNTKQAPPSTERELQFRMTAYLDPACSLYIPEIRDPISLFKGTRRVLVVTAPCRSGRFLEVLGWWDPMREVGAIRSITSQVEVATY